MSGASTAFRPDLPDLDVVRRVLASRAGEVVEVVALPDDGAPRARPLRLPEDLEDGVAFVRKHAGAGGTVSIGVATLGQAGAERLAELHRRRRAGHSRTGEHEGYRWVVADLDPSDGVDLDALRIRLAELPMDPTLLVHSGRGLHAWWALRTPVSIEAGAQVMADLARALGSDEGTTNPTRVLRIAGTWNGKPEAQCNARIELDELDTRAAPQHRYSAEELSDAACTIAPRPEPSRPHPGPGDRPGRGEGPDLIAELKREHPLAELLDALSGPRRGKAWHCPVCDSDGGHEPTLSVVGEHWTCFRTIAHPDEKNGGAGRKRDGGHTSGDVIDLLAWQAGVTHVQFLADERRRRGLPGPKRAGKANGQTAGRSAGRSAHEGQDENSKRRVADQVYELSKSLVTLVRSTVNNDSYAMPVKGPQRLMKVDTSPDELGGELRLAWEKQGNPVLSGKDLKDVVEQLAAASRQLPPQDVHLRCAEIGYGSETRIVVDLADLQSRAVVIDQQDWAVVERPPVLFRRTGLSGVMPVPERGGDLDELRELLNVTDETWPLLVGWMVAALFSEIPHGILLLTGEAGAGKTSAGRMLAELLDPSPSPLSSPPRDVQGWISTADNSFIVGIDNLSKITPEFADQLCRASSGEAVTVRKFFTNNQTVTMRFKRSVILTSIGASGMSREDLNSRLLAVELRRIPREKKLGERKLRHRWDQLQPRLLGALFDLAVQVLQHREQAEELLRISGGIDSRLADFYVILAACDLVRGTSSIKLFGAMQDQLAEELVDSDFFAAALLDYCEDQFESRRRLGMDPAFRKTPRELLEQLRPPSDMGRDAWWPKDPSAVGQALGRRAGSLRSVGLIVESGRDRRARYWSMSPAQDDVPVRTHAEAPDPVPAPPAQQEEPPMLDGSWGQR